MFYIVWPSKGKGISKVNVASETWNCDGSYKKLVVLAAGILILNLVCRDQELKSQVLSDMQSVFPWLGTLEVKDQVNEIVLALPQARGKDWNNSGAQEKIIEVLCASASKLQHKVQPAHKNKLWDKSLDLCGMMAGLRVLWLVLPSDELNSLISVSFKLYCIVEHTFYTVHVANVQGHAGANPLAQKYLYSTLGDIGFH